MSDLFQRKYKIKSIRLPGWDYSQPATYFVTICVREKKSVFGHIKAGIFSPSSLGKAVSECWISIPDHFRHVQLGEFVIMPNHLHGILFFKESNLVKSEEKRNFVSLERPQIKNHFGPQSKNLASVIRGFKIGVTKKAKEFQVNFSWQKGYYETIIESQYHLIKAEKYIENNPFSWTKDPYFIL